jgi:hypothetical protein
MGRRSHPIVFITLFCSVIVIAVVFGWYLADRSAEEFEAASNGFEEDAPVFEKREIHLYFGDHQGRYLKAEQRIVEQPVDDVAFGRRILEALLEGPKQGTSRSLPPDAGLRAFFIVSDGTAYVDFEAGSFDNHPGGVETELLSIYSIVNTLVLNVEKIRSVKLLIGGQEAATLAGHVDLSHPLKADMLWVR